MYFLKSFVEVLGNVKDTIIKCLTVRKIEDNNHNKSVITRDELEYNDNNSDDDEEIPEGRLTPSIQKAIRRSVHNIRRSIVNSDRNNNEGEVERQRGSEEINNGDKSNDTADNFDNLNTASTSHYSTSIIRKPRQGQRKDLNNNSTTSDSSKISHGTIRSYKKSHTTTKTYEREQALTVETLKIFHGSLNSCPAEDEQVDDPRGLKLPLMGHQKHALAWLIWREHQKPPGGVLADDMGLGKTLTMISLILKSMEAEDSGGESDEERYSNQKSSKPAGGTLVVCPASLIGQWEFEVKRRCKRGLLKVELYHGNKRENLPGRLARNDIVITTYNLLSREHRKNHVLFRIKWKRVILDEGHVIRNHKSQVCETVCALEAQRRWILTGTPIHNKGIDLFSVLKFLQCAPFNDIRVWKRWVDCKEQTGYARLTTVMKTLMLRRTKMELMSSGAVENLPEKSLEIKWVQLDHEERLVYDKIMLYSKTIFAQYLHQQAEKKHMAQVRADVSERLITVNKNVFNKTQQRLLAQHAHVKSHQILELFLRLRQICCHPSLIHAMLDEEEIEQTGIDDNDMDLIHRMGQMKIGGFDGDEEVPDGPAEVDERVAEDLLTSDNPVFERSRESSKLRAVLELLGNILEKDEKVIIVSQWTSVLDIIAENLKKIEGATFKSLTGAVHVRDRSAIVDNFNRDGDPRVLLLSLTAGGVGLNLVGANHLMLVDIHWNPQLESQAQDRIYRFGQKKNVFIYKFLCTDTIEEQIKAMQDLKLELAKNVLSGSGKGQSVKLTLDDLRSIFGL